MPARMYRSVHRMVHACIRGTNLLEGDEPVIALNVMFACARTVVTEVPILCTSMAFARSGEPISHKQRSI